MKIKKILLKNQKSILNVGSPFNVALVVSSAGYVAQNCL